MYAEKKKVTKLFLQYTIITYGGGCVTLLIVRFSANDAKLLSKSPVNTFLFPESDAPKNYKINKSNVNLFYQKINYQSK